MEISKKVSSDVEEKGEISLKDLILTLTDWIRYFWKKKILIIVCGFLGAGLGILYAYIKVPTYNAELTFVVEDNQSSPLGSYAGLASQFGLDLGGTGNSNGAFSGDNILELLKSRRLVEKALLSGHLNFKGKEISLGEYFIEVNELREKWKTKPELIGIHYPVNPNRSSFTLLQDSLLNAFQKAITDKYLKVEKPDKKLSFIKVTCATPDEQFSKTFTENLVKVATDMYIDTKTQRNKINVDRLQLQADSLEIALNKKTYSAARVQDLNVNPARQMANVGTELVLRDKMVLQTMYGEVIKNLELSKLAMTQETPVIQIIDTPILPLDKKKFGKLKGLIIGGLLGGFLTLIFLAIRKVYADVMK
jgi:hypothetical protein